MDTQKLSFDHRLVNAKVVAEAAPNHIDLELIPPLRGIRRVRLLRGPHWGLRQQPGDWHLGDLLPVFLFGLAAEARRGDGHGHWFGSAHWAHPANNPWHRAHQWHPAPGVRVKGWVSDYAGRSAVITIYAEDSGLEAYLGRDQVPAKDLPLEELFPLGLEIEAEISQVDSDQCKIELSVLRCLTSLRAQQTSTLREAGGMSKLTPYLRLIESSQWSFRRLSTQALIGKISDTHDADFDGALPGDQPCEVLVIDDDEVFGKLLVRWLQALGPVVATHAANLATAERLLPLSSGSYTHILLDHSMGDLHETRSLADLVSAYQVQYGGHVALITGLPENSDARKTAKDRKWGFLSKPFSFADMLNWLRDGSSPSWDARRYEPGDGWRRPGHVGATAQVPRAQRWLASVCRETGCVGGFWVRSLRPGHEWIAGHGLPGGVDAIRVTLGRMRHTLVADVEADGQRHLLDRLSDSILGPLWPDGATHCWARPMQEVAPDTLEAPPVGDILVLFGSRGTADLRNPDASDCPWPILTAWWRDLIALQRTETVLDEEAVFAIQGRVHAATLHELRPLMQPFGDKQPWSDDEARAWWPQGQRARALLNAGLYNIRSQRVPRFDLRERIDTLMRTFVWNLIHQRKVHVKVILPPSGQEVQLPPEVLEQPLINMVDNATKFCAPSPWALVTVEAFLDIEPNNHLPLVLRVTDQGEGMTPAQSRQLFHPQQHVEASGGFGMGLYTSRTLVHAVGGELRLAQNARWLGCAFELRLPLEWGAAT